MSAAFLASRDPVLGREVAEFRRALPCGPLVRDDEVHLFSPQRQERASGGQLGRALVIEDERAVDLPVAQHRRCGGRLGLAVLECDVRRFHREPPHQHRDQRGAGAREADEPQGPGALTAQVIDRGQRGIDLADDGAPVIGEDLPGRRQPDTSPAALDERNGEPGLDSLDALTHGRLAQPQ